MATAANPATMGEAKDVPDMALLPPGTAVQILTPGAVNSTYLPAEENLATVSKRSEAAMAITDG